jgi:hypothetical protein
MCIQCRPVFRYKIHDPALNTILPSPTLGADYCSHATLSIPSKWHKQGKKTQNPYRRGCKHVFVKLQWSHFKPDCPILPRVGQICIKTQPICTKQLSIFWVPRPLRAKTSIWPLLKTWKREATKNNDLNPSF